MCGYKSYRLFYTGKKIHVNTDVHFLHIHRKLLISTLRHRLSCPQPVVIVTGSIEKPGKAFLTCKKSIISEIPGENVALILLAAYYTFNMQYLQDCNNVFFFRGPFSKCHTPKKDKTSSSTKHV